MNYIDFEALNRPCACGVEHPQMTLVYREGPVEQVVQLIEGMAPRGASLLVGCDRNTYRVAGERAERALAQAGYRVSVSMLPQEHPHADMDNVERMRDAAQRAGAQLMVAVGAGTVGDVVRYSAKLLGLPFVTVGTALSMDGYASSVAPIVTHGFKRTMPAQPPLGLLADGEVLLTAGNIMSASGVGDMAGKLIALLDWRLAEICEGEHRCLDTVETTRRAANLAIDSADGLKAGDPEAAKALMGGLVLSGLMITRMGKSRPASGCEHMIAHYLEIRDLLTKRGDNLHGARVGVATLIMMEMYRRFFESPLPVRAEPSVQPDLDKEFLYAKDEVIREAGDVQFAPFEEQRARLLAQWDEMKSEVDQVTCQFDRVRHALSVLGGPVSMRELGYDRQEALNAVLYAKTIRTRFGLLRLMDSWGVLRQIAGQVMEELYA